jgi:hypothetical protein
VTQGVQTWLDGTTLVVRIPMCFQRRGGRKRIVAPNGSELVPATKPHPDSALLKALARASRWQWTLDDGIYTTVSDIGDAENISKSYVSRGDRSRHRRRRDRRQHGARSSGRAASAAGTAARDAEMQRQLDSSGSALFRRTRSSARSRSGGCSNNGSASATPSRGRHDAAWHRSVA